MNSDRVFAHTINASDGVELALYENNRDKPNYIVLCHGILTTHRCWDNIMYALTDYHVIRYDQRGHGQSGGRDGKNSTIAQLGHDLSSVLSYVHAIKGPAAKGFVASHSMGGMAIGSWVYEHPEQVAKYIRGIALCNTTLFDAIKGNRMLGFALPNWKILKKAAWIAHILPVTDDYLNRKHSHFLNFYGHRPTQDVQDAITRSAQTSPKVARKLLTAICLMDLSAAIDKFIMPTLVITADHDHLTAGFLGEKIAEKLAKQGTLSAIIEIKESGHLTIVNQTEQFLSALIPAIEQAFNS